MIVEGDTTRTAREQARLDEQVWRGRSAREQFDSSQCDKYLAALIEGEMAQPGSGPTPRLDRVDSLMANPPNKHMSGLGDLLLVRLLARWGRHDRVLAVIDRPRGFMPKTLIPAVLIEEAQAAAELGDTDRARASYEHYLTLRTDPDDLAWPQVAAVCAELRDVAGHAAERFETCRRR